MSKKRLFQVLDEMNQLDIENNTRTVAISNGFISADQVKQGCKVTMGADQETLLSIMNDNAIPLLIVVDKKTYNELK